MGGAVHFRKKKRYAGPWTKEEGRTP